MLNKEKKDEDLFVSGNAAKPIVVGIPKHTIKFRVFFYDGSDLKTGHIISFNEAMAENYIEWDESELKPTDECSILMQSTGFKDVKGNDIYEGDILSLWYSRDTTGKDIVKFNHTVVWEDTNGFSGWNIPFLESAEIIGNVFENPELL